MATQLLTENLVHHFCALGERGSDLVAIDRLGRGGAIVPGQQRDALHRDAVRGQDRDEGVPHLPGHPVLAEPCLLREGPERADHVIRGQGRTDRGGEDQAVILPELSSPQLVPGLKRSVLP